jgi:hypothetical protein
MSGLSRGQPHNCDRHARVSVRSLPPRQAAAQHSDSETPHSQFGKVQCGRPAQTVLESNRDRAVQRGRCAAGNRALLQGVADCILYRRSILRRPTGMLLNLGHTPSAVMIPSTHQASNPDHTVVRFRRRHARIDESPRPGGALQQHEPNIVFLLSLAKYESGEENDYRHRMIVNALAFAVTVALIAMGVWLASNLHD